MKKKILLCIATVILVVVGAVALTACSDYRYYSDDVFKDFDEESHPADRLDGTDVRIMSANTLVHMRNGYGGMPVKPRAQLFANALRHYTPDVIGLQEYSSHWYKEMPKELTHLSNRYEDTFTADYQLITDSTSKWTNIMYNATTLTLLDNDVFRYKEEANRNCRLVAWAVFETKSEPKQKFAVTSTHWDFGSTEDKIAIVEAQSIELAEFVNYLVATYEVPVYQTGDYNIQKNIYDTVKDPVSGNSSTINSIVGENEVYSKYVDRAKAKDVKYDFDNLLVENKVVTGDYFEFDVNAADAEGKPNGLNAEQWDYIFITNTAISTSKPLLVNLLHDFYFQLISDHPFMYVDIQI